MKVIARRLILGFQVTSSIYPKYPVIRDGIMHAFKMDLKDTNTKKLLQKHWGSQCDTKSAILYKCIVENIVII
jgi:hypothetical protein